MSAFGGKADINQRQSNVRFPAVGLLHGASQETFAANIAAFKQGLSQTGYIDGQNVTIEHRWANGRYDQLPALAADLVRRRVAVIATLANGALVAKAATTTTPIVFIMAEDPVKVGLARLACRARRDSTRADFCYLTRAPNNMPVRIVGYVLARSATWLARRKDSNLRPPDS